MEKLIIPSLLSINEFSYLSTNLLKVTEAFTASDVKFKLLHDRLADINHRLVQNLKFPRSSLYTARKEEADNRRDLRFRCVRDQLHGLMFSYDQERALPATQLYAVIEKIGTRLYDLGYKAESSLLLTLFEAFDQPNSQVNLTKLNLTNDYQALKTAEEEFMIIADEFLAEQTLRTTEGEAASDIIDELVPALTNLVACMQLYGELEPETYAAPYNQMVTIINEVNATARARKTRKKNEEPESPNSPA